MKRNTKKILIGIIGGIVVVIGLILVPYPGPGWLIVFAGFAILATEFAFAQRVLDSLRKRYGAWTAWLKEQPWSIQALVLACTGLIVLVTVYLLNAFGILNNILDLNQDWLISPFYR